MEMIAMKKIILVLLILLFYSCINDHSNNKETSTEPVRDNIELEEIHQNDQADRKSGKYDWMEMEERDLNRRKRLYELLDSNLLQTARDYKNAAMIFQHGSDSTDYKMAIRMMERSLELDSNQSKWLLAATTDRYLLSIGKPQIYGTQYRKLNDDPWELSEMDSSIISDEERIEFGVETLSEQKAKVREMNARDLK